MKQCGDGRTSGTAAHVVPDSPGAFPDGGRIIKLIKLTDRAFHDRFGDVDTARAIHFFTKPCDANIVLNLVFSQKPKRLLEIGTAAGHMTANLSEWSPSDAVIYSIGIVDGLETPIEKSEQKIETPSREHFGVHANYFKKAHKVLFAIADSLTFHFDRLAPLDFAFIDGAHDMAHVLSDTVNVYAALRPGGTMVWHDFDSRVPWVEVRQALERTAFPEFIHHVVGTEVAFLCKIAGKREEMKKQSSQRVSS